MTVRLFAQRSRFRPPHVRGNAWRTPAQTLAQARASLIAQLDPDMSPEKRREAIERIDKDLGT